MQTKGGVVLKILSKEKLHFSDVMLKSNTFSNNLTLNPQSNNFMSILYGNDISSKFITFTTLFPIGNYDIWVNQKDTGENLDIEPGSVNYYSLELDNDGDFYDTNQFGGSDCDDDNYLVNPGRPEICNNIDDNCDGETDGINELTDLDDNNPLTEDSCINGQLSHIFEYNDNILPEGLEFSGNNIVIDCNGGRIIGNGSIGSIGVSLNGEDITLKNCKIENYHQAIFLHGSVDSIDSRSYTITNNEIKNNSFGIILFVGIGNKVIINNNDIFNNTNYNILVGDAGSPNIDAQNNWWGTNNETEIENKIYEGGGNVEWEPYAQSSFFEDEEICVSDWTDWSEWSECIDRETSRQQEDLNQCDSENYLIIETEECSIECFSNWQCNTWTECSDGQQTRICNDLNSCGTNVGKPIEEKSCDIEPICEENWSCTSWSSCKNRERTRTCTDINSCGTTINKPDETKSCSSSSSGRSSNDNDDEIDYLLSNYYLSQESQSPAQNIEPLSLDSPIKITGQNVKESSVDFSFTGTTLILTMSLIFLILLLLLVVIIKTYKK